MSASHDAGPAPERLRGPLTGLAPEVKLAGLVAFLVVVATVPPTSPWPFLACGLVAVVVATLAFVDWRAVRRRIALEAPLVVLAVTYAVFGQGARTEVAGLSLSTAGLQAGGGILTKATIGVVAVSAIAASTTAPETVEGLRRLRAPAWFCELVAVAARQLDVVRETYERLRLAASVRSGRNGRLVGLGVATRSLGSLLVRSVERADRLQLAGALRGAGTAPLHPVPAAGRPARSTGGAGAWAAALAPALVAVGAVVVLP